MHLPQFAPHLGDVAGHAGGDKALEDGQRPARPDRDSLRSMRAGAVWTGLPLRERHLLEWLLAADIVSAELASLLVYRQLRTAQRRLHLQ